MNRRHLISSAVLGAVVCVPLAQAHPHVFVDSSLRIFVEDGRAKSVEVTWVYDDFFSLLIFEDMQLDPDGDGVLTKAELGRLRGFDFEVWPEGFEGDLYAYSNGTKLDLAMPEVTGIAVDQGRIVSRHVRRLPDVPAAGLELQQYDPTYYVAYALDSNVVVEGGCSAAVEKYDPDAAAKAIEDELNSVPEDVFEQMKVGIHFADWVRLSCDPSS